MWQLKAVGQGVLSRVPGGLSLKSTLGRVMRRPPDLGAQVRSMLSNYRNSLAELSERGAIVGADIAEIGTGWMPVVPILLGLAGARSIYTCDHLRHVRHKEFVGVVRALAAKLDGIAEWLPLDVDSARRTLDAMQATGSVDGALALVRVRYDAPADATRLPLADRSVDVHYSYSVVENMPVPVLLEALSEAKRVLRPGGWLSWVAGCSDPCRTFDPRLPRVHYLRYEDWYWNLLTSNPFSFNNRLRQPDFLRFIEGVGGQVVSVRSHVHAPDVERVRTMRLPERFRGLDAADVAVHKAEMLARFGGEALDAAPPKLCIQWIEAA